LKDGLEQIYMNDAFKEIMTFVENTSIKMNESSKMKDITDMAEDGPDGLLITEEDCTKLASNLKSILL